MASCSVGASVVWILAMGLSGGDCLHFWAGNNRERARATAGERGRIADADAGEIPTHVTGTHGPSGSARSGLGLDVILSQLPGHAQVRCDCYCRSKCSRGFASAKWMAPAAGLLSPRTSKERRAAAGGCT